MSKKIVPSPSDETTASDVSSLAVSSLRRPVAISAQTSKRKSSLARTELYQETLSGRLVLLVERLTDILCKLEAKIPMFCKLGAMVSLGSVLLIVGCLFALIPQSQVMSEMSNVDSVVDLLTKVTELIDAAQIERGTYGLYVASGGKFHLDTLNLRISRTEEKRSLLREELQNFNTDLFNGEQRGLTHLNAFQFFLEGLPDHRESVKSLSLTVKESTGYIVRMNNHGIRMIEELNRQITVGSVNEAVHELTELAWTKEYTGILRALGSAAFTADSFSGRSAYLDYVKIHSKSETHYEGYKKYAADEDIARMEESLLDLDVQRADAMDQVLLNSPYPTQLLFQNKTVEPVHWFGNISIRIEKLGVMEQWILSQISAQAQSTFKEAENELALILAYMICSICGMLIFSTVLSLAIYISHRFKLREKNLELALAESISYSISRLELDAQDVKFLMKLEEKKCSKLQIAIRMIVENMLEFKQFIPQNIIDSMQDIEPVERKKNIEIESTSTMLERQTSNSHGLFHLSTILQTRESRTKYGLTGKEMSLLVMNIENFHKLGYMTDPSRIAGVHSDIVHITSKLIKEHGGVFHNFQGDYLISSFNSAKKCFNFEQRACRAALTIQSELVRRFQPIWKANGLPVVTVNFAITSGRFLAGNIGSDSVKAYSNIGQNATIAFNMVKYNKKYELPSRILIDQKTYIKIKQGFQAFITDAGTCKHVQYRDSDTTKLFVLAGEKQCSADEWFYELDQLDLQSSGLEEEIQKCWSMVMADKIEQARELYEELHGKISLDEKKVNRFHHKTMLVLERHLKRMESTGSKFKCYL